MISPVPQGLVPTAEEARPARTSAWRDGALASLLLLPFALLAVDSGWIFSSPSRDAWIYYGYFQNAVAYLKRFPEVYYSSRLAVNLPGFAVHHLLPPLAANLALHLALYWAAVLSFHLVVRRMFGTRTAWLTAIAFGCHPFLLRALGWNYVDGFGIAYFLIALLCLTPAAGSQGSRGRRPLLAAAGAMVTAIVSTNVFYGIYVPVLAGHFLVLRRQGREHDREHVPLSACALWAGLGAAGLFALLGAASRAMGGPFFYLGSSLSFLSGSLGTANIFRDATYGWLSAAVWLAFPVLVLAGGLVALLARRRNASSRPDDRHDDRLFLWTHGQLLYLALVLVYFQVAGDTAVLQHFYYASLLIPSAFLAFAGQVARVVPDLSGRRLAALAGLVALLQIVPLLLPRIPALSAAETSSLPPLPLALLAGLVTVAVLALRVAGTRATLALFLGLALSQAMVRQGGATFWKSQRYGGDAQGLFLQISRGILAIERFDPSHQVRLWYDMEEERNGVFYDALASAFLLCPRMVSGDFPDLHGGRMCDGVQLGPGVPVAVLSTDPDAFEKARTSLQGVGLSARLLAREEIAGPARGFAITYLRTESTDLGAAP